MAKRKQKTLYKLSEEAASLLQLIVRLKAADEHGMVVCVTCGCRRHYKDNMQGGHFISRGKMATKLTEENVHPQCSGCNLPGAGVEAAYGLWMLDVYGKEFIEELHFTSRKVKKYLRHELEDIIAELKAEVKELEEQYA